MTYCKYNHNILFGSLIYCNIFALLPHHIIATYKIIYNPHKKVEVMSNWTMRDCYFK